MRDAKLCWITREQRDALALTNRVGSLALAESFDAAPEPVERRRCVTHDAPVAEGSDVVRCYHGADHWQAAEAGYVPEPEPCRFVSVFEVPASPSDPSSETPT